ncbi:MAG: alpha-ketoacid dehydrogenase subunit beta, partial [Limnobacter sp.]|nr:alpha-ketoacid dehydrogenase subunit beta [Limnobacter sp.]
AVIRMPNGIWSSSAAQHSQSLEAWFAHMPGLVVACPATPQDNHAMLRAALECGDPVCYFEHKELWGLQGEVDPAATVKLGQARRVREGGDLTIVSWSKAVHWSAEAAETLAGEGIAVDLLDLRTIWPWDRDAVLASAARTKRVLIAHEAIQVAGFGAEIAATLAEHSDARVARCGGPRIPVGYSPGLEAQARLGPATIVQRARELMQRE